MLSVLVHDPVVRKVAEQALLLRRFCSREPLAECRRRTAELVKSCEARSRAAAVLLRHARPLAALQEDRRPTGRLRRLVRAEQGGSLKHLHDLGPVLPLDRPFLDAMHFLELSELPLGSLARWRP